MKRFIFLLVMAITLFGRAESPRLNVVFILIDDMGWRDLVSYGSTFYETPNVDRLAAQGMKFTNAYAACPVCSPTRASIMTGQYPARVGITDFIGGHNHGKLNPAPYLDHLPLEQVTLAEALHDAGYQTWHIGKWHLGGKGYWPTDQGFDVNVGGWAAGHPASYFSPYKNPNLKDGPKGEYLTDRLTNEAIKLIQNRDKSRPFYLNLWHYAVHIPIQSPKDLIEKYKKKAAAMGLSEDKAFVTGEKYPYTEAHGRHVIRRIVQGDPAYAAMIEKLDTNIGRLMAELDKQGLADNTIVIFTSDNGGVMSETLHPPTCNSPLLEGKGWEYEGGVREPLIVRWPGVVKAGSVSDGVVTSTDYYPTLLEAAGLPAKPKQHVDGVSIVPLLKGSATPVHDAIYWYYPHYSNQGGRPAGWMREGDFKLIDFLEDHHVELYNLKDDLSEKHDLSKEQPERVKEMLENLHAWEKDVGAKEMKVNPDWED